MAKSVPYGGRWKSTGNSLGEGGQAVVLAVTDQQGEYEGVYALKRLGRDERIDRFRQEIETLRRINHPNVVKIVDHSGDSIMEHDDRRHWFVMPLAGGKNLERRARFYTGNLDGVVKIAMQVAGALSAAHAIGIVHRDVKPANILFPDTDSHFIWLSDFGICHDPANERLTAQGEVMGARWFTAPELETGSLDAVTPAADVYSLGKVIYYMLSGGKHLAREETGTEEFKGVFARGERYTDLHLLLLRMICPVESRIRDISEVVARLDKIAKWEEVARRPPSTAQSPVIERLHRESAERRRIAAENQQARKSEQETQRVFGEAIMSWLRARLADEAERLRQPDLVDVELRDVAFGPGLGMPVASTGHHGPTYRPYCGHEMLIRNVTDTFPSIYVLRFLVCRRAGPAIVVQTGNALRSEPARDVYLGILPFFNQMVGPDFRQGHMMGFLNKRAELERINREAQQRMQQMPTRRFIPQRQPSISKSFIGEPVSQFASFMAANWTDNQERIETMIGECIETVVEYMMSDTKMIGP